MIRLPHVWKRALGDDGQLAETVIATPIIHNGDVLLSSRKDGGRAILSLNSKDGSINWQWNDLLDLATRPGYKDPIILYAESYYQYEGKLFFTYTGSSYCIDLAGGNTLWKNKEDRHRFDRNAGLSDQYYTSGCTYEPMDDEKIYVGSINSSDREQLLLTPSYTAVSNPPLNAQGRIWHNTPFQLNKIGYVAFGTENPYTDFSDSGWGYTELNLYNLTEQR